MSPRYEPDLTKISATFELFSKGEYEFLVGEPKGFEQTTKTGKNAGQQSIGVRYPIVLGEETNGHKAGSKNSINCYIHNDGSMGFSKQFLMACLGYPITNAGERKFDEDFRGQDWSVDADTGAVGDVWRQATGKRVRITADLGTNPTTGEPSNQFGKYQPITAAA